MAITLVSHLSAGSPDGYTFTSGSMDSTGADFIVAEVTAQDYTPELYDSKGNTASGLVLHAYSNFYQKLFYFENPIVGSGHTFEVRPLASLGYFSLCVAAFSGLAPSSVFDVQSAGGSVNDISTTTGSATPSQDNSLIIAGIGGYDPASISINGGFTITDTIYAVGGLNLASSLAYLVQTSATAANPTWSWSGTSSMATGLAVFKPSTGGQPTMVRRGGVPYTNYTGRGRW